MLNVETLEIQCKTSFNENIFDMVSTLKCLTYKLAELLVRCLIGVARMEKYIK